MDNAERIDLLDGKVQFKFADGRIYEPSWSRALTLVPYEKVDNARKIKPRSYTGVDRYITPPGNPNLVVISRPGYDYVPSVMWDEGKYKIWWCSNNNVTFDTIWYAEKANITDTGYLLNPVQVFQGNPPGGNFANCNLNSNFDCTHTCDPSVIKIGGTYFMYYTGFPVGSNYNGRTKIGVAASPNGITNWTRLNTSNQSISVPVVTPFSAQTFSVVDDADYNQNGNTSESIGVPLYGSGHPTVTFSRGKFYLSVYDDTTNVSLLSGVTLMSQALTIIGQQFQHRQYAARSSDSTFQTGVEEWRNSAWVSISNGTQTSRTSSYLANTAGADWHYSPRTNQFLLSIDGLQNYTSVRFFASSLNAQVEDVLHASLGAPWTEGPCVAKLANGQTMRSPLCTDYWFNVLRSNGTPITSTWDLAHVGWAFTTLLTSCGEIFHDYEGDGMSDAIVYRPSNSTFYIRNTSATPVVRQITTGGTNTPVQGDFDGDGITDYGLIRNTSNLYYWYLYFSTTGTVLYQPTWGVTGDKIITGDFNGDKKEDFGVWRPSDGTWYPIYTNNGSFSIGTTQQWGLSGDIPVKADFDRDGKVDFVVYRPSFGNWYIKLSSTGGTPAAVQLGLSGDVPLSADFSGDGIPDYVVWRPSDGNWYAKSYPSGTALTTVQWGLPGDIPMVGDYDGDGAMDRAVYRIVGGQGKWFIRYNTGANETVNWGVTGDLIPSNRN